MGNYLLFAGDNYYPGGGFNDYRGRFETLEDALAWAARKSHDWWHVVYDCAIVADSYHGVFKKPRGRE